MAAGHQPDRIFVIAYQITEFFIPVFRPAVKSLQTAFKRKLMHHNHRRFFIGIIRQNILQPQETFFIQRAVHNSLLKSINRNQPQRITVNHILQTVARLRKRMKRIIRPQRTD